MHKIVLTILHMLTGLILWEDRHGDNFKNQDFHFFFLTDLLYFFKFFSIYLFLYLFLIIFLW